MASELTWFVFYEFVLEQLRISAVVCPILELSTSLNSPCLGREGEMLLIGEMIIPSPFLGSDRSVQGNLAFPRCSTTRKTMRSITKESWEGKKNLKNLSLARVLCVLCSLQLLSAELEGCLFKDRCNILRIAGAGLTQKENWGFKILEGKICQETGQNK